MLISEDYRQQNAAMHAEKPHYGAGSRLTAEVVKLVRWNAMASILDYGCGKGALKQSLPPNIGETVSEYDPAIPGKEQASPAELVVCADVLEHIEPECLADVLADLRRLTLKVGLFLIATVPANKHLPDGRNAHLIVEPAQWWRERLAGAGFLILKEQEKPDGLLAVVA